jgi:hypothetical protein
MTVPEDCPAKVVRLPPALDMYSREVGLGISMSRAGVWALLMNTNASEAV